MRCARPWRNLYFLPRTESIDRYCYLSRKLRIKYTYLYIQCGSSKMQKRWNVLEADEAKIKELQAQLKISDVLCRLLVIRCLETFDQARRYFRPALSELH